MSDVVGANRLTHEGALNVLRAAMQKAEEMGVPQCIAVTDAAGRLLAFVRMDGAKFLSIRTSIRKAMTAASSAQPTGSMDQEVAAKLAFTTGDASPTCWPACRSWWVKRSWGPSG
jgi:glc operon protein GlcG